MYQSDALGLSFPKQLQSGSSEVKKDHQSRNTALKGHKSSKRVLKG